MSQENITLKINNPASTMDENKLYLEKKITYYQELMLVKLC